MEPAILTLPTGRTLQTPHWQSMLKQITTLEKKTFPKSEAMDIPSEVGKRGIICWIMASAPAEASTNRGKGKKPKREEPSGGAEEKMVLAYALLGRSSALTRLHKLCVHPSYRRKGLAERLLGHVFKYLDGEGGVRKQVDLWVDLERDGARRLYEKVGFREEEVVVGYYGEGRDGCRMVRGG